MRLLADTHFALWLATDLDELTPAELKLTVRRDIEMLVSAVAIWELQLKWNRFHASGDRKGPADPREVLDLLVETGVQIVSLTADQAAATLDPELMHTDPFDRLLVLQAQELGARLWTRDPKLLAHPIGFSA